MMKTLQARLGLLFVAFALLVIISVAAMYWGLESQRQAALIIDLAGRQRMLAQQMARMAFESGSGKDANNAALQATEQTFDQTLQALLAGGPAPYQTDEVVTLPVTQNPEISVALKQESLAWIEYRTLLDALQQTAPGDPSFSLKLQSIQEESGTLVQRADAVVHLYDADSTYRTNRLRTIQLGFLAAALALLAVAVLVTRQSVLKPLSELSRAAARLRGNDLDTMVRVDGPTEVQALAQSFNAMREGLRSSRQELLRLNESLEERVTQRTRELETLNEVSRDISSRLDIQQVLDSVTEKARSLLGGEVASLCLVDDSQHWLRLQAVSGPRNAVEGDTVLVDDSLPGMVLDSEQALLCGTGACQGGCRMLSDRYRVSHMAASLRIGERVIGALCVGSRVQNRFAGEATNMLTQLANAAAIALENARLYAQAERVAALEERRRVAAEMHDGLGQTLSYLGLMTDQVVDFLSEGQDQAALERLQKTRDTIGKATDEVRRAINSLMDESDSHTDLCTRLHQTAAAFAADHHLEIDWQADAATQPKCPPQTAEQVLNIASEALNNVVHHAQAQQVRLRVGHTPDAYFVSVEDDGRGFDPSQPEPNGHFGLQIMQARAAHIGGRLEIESRPGGGTRVILTWPIEGRE
ncbi:MAG TPA: ATP-binding protein [Anaerolineales bacterium]